MVKNMSFEQKKARAIAIMESKNMWKSNYAPPLIRGLWKLGLKIPPLPFAPFWQTILIMGIFFGPVFGFFMWFSLWKHQSMSLSMAIRTSLMAGVLFGVLMAAFHWWLKKRNKLPDWNELEW
jgi:fatty acid desaturase